MSKEVTSEFVFDAPKLVYQCGVFAVQERTAQTADLQHSLKVYKLHHTNWVNIVPVTSTGEVVLVEQYRFGVDAYTLELPGGSVERNEKDVTQAALRELEEETGLTTKRILSLPGFCPNPAIQSNRITYFIALDVQPVTHPVEFFDPFEKIKVHLVPVSEALKMARTGQITHALSALAILLAEPYLSKWNGN